MSDKIELDIYRYERKFFIRNFDRTVVEKMILNNPAHFSEIYQDRFVNNIYFDSMSFKNYIDNIDGNTFRTKYRIRWYGDFISNLENPVLEIKIKKGLVGTKKNYPLIPFDFKPGIDSNDISSLIQKSQIPQNIKSDLKNQIPMICNRYRRSYFLSSDGKFRITIDDNQSFFKLKKFNNNFLSRFEDTTNLILELKYRKEDDAQADEISAKLPFRSTKSSKYARAIKLVYN